MTALVIDNDSADGTVNIVTALLSKWTGMKLIANRDNRGFAGAVNQGVNIAAKDDLVLLLNPDTQLQTPLEPLVSAATRDGLAAGKLLDENGRTQAGFNLRRFPTPATLIFETFGINRLWPANPINRRYRCLDKDTEVAELVEQPAGAFLIFRRDVWQKLKGFDERFHPVWFEDVDFCRRAVQAGYPIDYEPAAAALHQGGHSLQPLAAKDRAIYWCVSLLKYSQKHFGSVAFRCIAAAVAISSIPRMLARMLQERRLTPLTGYCKIIGFALQCLISPHRVWRPI